VLHAIRPVSCLCAVAAAAMASSAHDDGSLHVAAAIAIGSWIRELAGRFAAAGLARTEAQELASSLVTILEGAHVLARATGGTDRFDETARAVTALVEQRYGR
jgi:TetR/AcrR family transcriptional repressor of lmrAB and yxaGH operons